LVNEEEVVCGVIKWLVNLQINWNEEKKDIEMGFWIDTKSFNSARNLLNTEENLDNFKPILADRFQIDIKILNKCFLGILDLKIPWYESHNLIPDIVVHNYYISEAYSETWANYYISEAYSETSAKN